MGRISRDEMLRLEQEARGVLVGESIAFMLFGSVVRGDAEATSDLDVLQLSPSDRLPYHMGRVAVSVYTPKQLRAVAESGGLFVLHLRREGHLVWDPESILSDILESYRESESGDAGLVRQLVVVRSQLDVDDVAYKAAWSTLHRVALFAYRTAVYLVAKRRGVLTFGMTSVAAALGDPTVAAVYRLKLSSAPDRGGYLSLVRVFDQYLSDLSANLRDVPFGYTDDESVANWAIRLIGGALRYSG